jgi:hypothetical protein
MCLSASDLAEGCGDTRFSSLEEWLTWSLVLNPGGEAVVLQIGVTREAAFPVHITDFFITITSFFLSTTAENSTIFRKLPTTDLGFILPLS